MDYLKNSKILGIVGNALVAVGCFLPFVSVSVFGISQSASYIQGDGAFVLILSIIALVMIFADKLVDKVPFLEKVKNPKLTLIPTALSAILVIIAVVNSTSAGGLGGGLVNVSFGFGFWMIVVGLVASAVYPFLYKGE